VILIDTGPIVALFDVSDHFHGKCLELLKGLRGPLITTWPVITEAIYLLNFSLKAQDGLWEFLIRGGVEVAHVGIGEMARCRELMTKYGDLPMDLADATLVALGEKRNIDRIFTLDHRDFKVYRPAHVKRFKLIPDCI
jgi:predicted nucleic acid-binding protein